MIDGYVKSDLKSDLLPGSFIGYVVNVNPYFELKDLCRILQDQKEKDKTHCILELGHYYYCI